MSGDEAIFPPSPGLSLRAVRGAFPIGAALGASAVAGAGGVFLLSSYHLSFVVCYFKLMTGLPCLTCGGTRATVRLLSLDPAGALAMNPLVTLAGFLVAAWAIADVALLTRGRALRVGVSPQVARVLRIAIPLAVAANWAYLIAAGR